MPFTQKKSSSSEYQYNVPVESTSPWPLFRRDHKNTGRSPIPANYTGDQPWSFQTGKGIFSTPVVDGNGTIYFGSADHKFYAVSPDGHQKWQYETGEIIDSAGALPRVNSQMTCPTVIFPSGDGHLYLLRCDNGQHIWSFDARVSPRKSYNNWFEANVAVGPDGSYYAGNTNFNYYAVNPDGSLKWTYPTGSNNWSQAAFADDGTIFWTSCDTLIHAVGPDGVNKWTKRTLGFLAASVAIGSDGTLYVGSFDSYFFALHPDNGKVKWKFKTHDHIYSSAALGIDETGETSAIYFGSTDGIFYALNLRGDVMWMYDTGAPIRSSAAIGRCPDGEPGDIVYFGCGNGKLYALNTGDGTRRWSFDTTPEDPDSRDRNELNGSPALGKTGVYIGGEHGQLWYIPYDYCLHTEDKRASTAPGEDLPADTKKLFYVSPGGKTVMDPPASLPAATLITLRLVVRKGGRTINARLFNSPFRKSEKALQIIVTPEFPFTAETSADGKFLHIIPHQFLTPDTTYQITVRGNFYAGGFNIGNLTLGGRKAGRFETSFRFTTASVVLDKLPLSVGKDRVSALEWTRMAVPIPTMLPSLNQIGFDYMDWILGTVAVSKPDDTGRGKFILWAIGGQRNADGRLVAEPNSDFTLPLSGLYQKDSFILINRNFKMAVTGIPIPFNVFQLRGQIQQDLTVRPCATAYAETKVLSIPTFGPLLIIAGLANNVWRKLLPFGTYVTRPYEDHSPANKKPSGITVAKIDYTPAGYLNHGRLTASFTLQPGAIYPLTQHRAAIVLIDGAAMEPVILDYHKNLSARDDAGGNLSTVTLTIPARTRMPSQLEAVVMVDVFPLCKYKL